MMMISNSVFAVHDYFQARVRKTRENIQGIFLGDVFIIHGVELEMIAKAKAFHTKAAEKQ